MLPSKRKSTGLFPSFSNMIEDFFRDDDGFFRNWTERQNLPAVNVKETDKFYMLEVAAPGMKKDDFKVEIDNGVLTISSENKTESEEKDDNYMRREFSCSSFSRSFWLPENIKEEDIKAEYKDGVLMVSVPRPKGEIPKANRKTIKIS